MHHLDLILTLTGGLAAALILGYITQRLGLSPIIGYLLAGVAVGPTTPGFIANPALANEMAELGVVLLMFGVGLHFHLKDLLAVRHVAVPGAIGQSLTATLLGCLLTMAFGWDLKAGIVFGLAISVASTVVLLRVLADNNDLHTPAGHIAVGWLVVEDVFTVLVLVMLPVLFQPAGPTANAAAADGMGAGGGAGSVALALGWSVLKIAIFVGFIFFVGGRVIPWLLEQVAATRSRELFTLAVLVLALGIAVGAAKLFGVSMALGAFLAGMVVGRSDYSSRAASEALPMRDAFAVLFFVSVGMLFKPMYLLEAPILVAATVGTVLVGKPLAALVIVLLLKYPLRVALAVSVALAQIGEFSFILATLGTELHILPAAAMNTLVAAAIVSISINPALYRLIDLMESRAKRSPRLWRLLSGRSSEALQASATAHLQEPQGQVIVVGYGPVGRTLVRLLLENDIPPTVVELNMDTVRRLRDEGLRAVYGDAAHKETLIAAGIEQAAALLLTSSAVHGADEAIRVARECNPAIRVLARAGYLREVPTLRRAGADAVFSGEGEVALTMTEFMLRQLGATAEQIDRARDRIRNELFGTPQTVELLLPLPHQAAGAPQEPAGAEHQTAGPEPAHSPAE
ncbi:MAG TPA: cation:proton antiporter [Pirellulaceae bacterium]|nr:cation:proton antiporter [Pirellulaceae bacterium]